MTNLAGRVALVTGGGRGIGRAVALALADAGADVAVLARTTTELESVAGEVRALGRRAAAVTADVADTPAVADAVERARASLGGIDILVANAGVVWPLGSTLAVDPDEWSRAVDLNLAGSLRAIRACVPAMVERGFGRVVTITSGAAKPPGMPAASAYSAGKAALELLTVHLAGELSGTGVTANAVRPGIIDTAMQSEMRAAPRESVGAAFYDRFHGVHERGELVDPTVPGRFVAALAATELTGQILDVRDDVAWRLLDGHTST